MTLTPLDEASIEVITVPKGKILFRQGDKGDAAYIVNSGAVGIYREIEGRKLPLATIRRGELFGEMAVIDGSPRMASAFTLEESTLMMISVDMMGEKMRKTDPFIKALVQMLMNNLRSVHDSYTPKSRSLLDSVNALQRQSEMLGKFVHNNVEPKYKTAIEAKLTVLDRMIQDLNQIANDYRKHDRRDDAIPSLGELPST